MVTYGHPLVRCIGAGVANAASGIPEATTSTIAILLHFFLIIDMRETIFADDDSLLRIRLHQRVKQEAWKVISAIIRV